MRFGMLSTSLSHCSWMALFQAWCKNSSCWAWVDGLWPSSFLLITFQRFSRGFGPGVWAGHVRVLIWWSSIHSLIGQAEWLEPCPTLKKTVLSVRGHCQNRRKPVLAQDNFVCSFSDASFARMNLTDFSLAEAPSDHHRFSAKFHSRCKTLQFVDLSRSLANHWMTSCWIRCEIWPRIGDNLRMLQQGLNWADSSSQTLRHWSHIQSYLGPKLVSFCSDNAPERWGLFF